MPAPKKANTGPATAAVVRKGHETMAAKLRVAGWLVLSPEDQLGDRFTEFWGMGS